MYSRRFWIREPTPICARASGSTTMTCLSLATCPSNILAEIHRPARSRLIDSNATKKLINIAFAFGRTEHVPRQRTLAFEQRMELYVE